MEITKNSKILDILKAYPPTIRVFNKFHLHPIRNIHRNLEAVTCERGVDLEKVLEELNGATLKSGIGEEGRAQPDGSIHENMTFRYVTTRYPATNTGFSRHGVLELAKEHWPDEKIFFFGSKLIRIF